MDKFLEAYFSTHEAAELVDRAAVAEKISAAQAQHLRMSLERALGAVRALERAISGQPEPKTGDGQ